jgi:hypothetical protein
MVYLVWQDDRAQRKRRSHQTSGHPARRDQRDVCSIHRETSANAGDATY